MRLLTSTASLVALLPLPTEWDPVWASQSVWMLKRRKKSLACPRNRRFLSQMASSLVTIMTATTVFTPLSFDLDFTKQHKKNHTDVRRHFLPNAGQWKPWWHTKDGWSRGSSSLDGAERSAACPGSFTPGWKCPWYPL